MSQGEDPDVFLSTLYQIEDEITNMNESVSDGRLAGIVTEGLTDDYSQIKYDAERDPDFSPSQIESTMRNLCINRPARGKSVRKPVRRDSALIAASPVEYSGTKTVHQVRCFTCGTMGHQMRECRSTQQSNDSGRQTKWCTLHRTANHHNTECRSQNTNKGTGSNDGN
ncbi:unnamed protein product, partial [Sphacelaria rigidula]